MGLLHGCTGLETHIESEGVVHVSTSPVHGDIMRHTRRRSCKEEDAFRAAAVENGPLCMFFAHNEAFLVSSHI